VVSCLLTIGVARINAGPILSTIPVDSRMGDDLGVAPGIPQVDEAIKRFQQGDPDAALRSLEAARKAHPELPPPKYMLARLQFVNQRVSEAIASLEQAAAEEPDFPGTYLLFGNLALGQDRVTDAVVHYENALRLAERGTLSADQKSQLVLQAQQGRAAIAERRRDWSTARDALTAWLELDPANGQARQRLAHALYRLNEQAAALRELGRAAADDPALDPPQITWGWFLTEQESLDEADASMRSAVSGAPDDPRTHHGYALWLIQQEKFEQAEREISAAARLDPESTSIKLVQGLVARHQQRFPLAETCFATVVRENPADFVSSNQLALVLAEQEDAGKLNRAVQLAEMNARQYPQRAEALSTLGRVYFHLKRNEDAIRLLEAAVATGQATADTRYYLARALAAVQRWERVQALLDSVLDAPLGQFSFRREATEWREELTPRTARTTP
jgi:tetratricopeptide (TPR) repeat protein